MKKFALSAFVCFSLVVAGCGKSGNNAGGGGGSTSDQGADTEQEQTSDNGSAKQSTGSVDKAGENWVEVSGTVSLKGEKSEPEKRDAKSECKLPEGENQIVLDRVKVGSENGLQDVIVWLEAKDGSIPALKTALPSREVTIDQKGCRFHPSTAIMHVDGTLKVTNSDAGNHNFNYTDGGFVKGNISQEKGASDKVDANFEAGSFITFECNVHPWMGGILAIAGHHAYDLTDKDGKFNLNKVPPGTYSLNLRHQLNDKPTTHEITVKEDGTVEGADLSKLELSISK